MFNMCETSASHNQFDYCVRFWLHFVKSISEKDDIDFNHITQLYVQHISSEANPLSMFLLD